MSISPQLREGIRSAKIQTAMLGMHPELVERLPPEDWPEVLLRLQATYRRVTNQPNAVLTATRPHQKGE